MSLSQKCNELVAVHITILPIRDLWSKRLSNLPKVRKFISDTARILSILTLKSQFQSHILNYCCLLLPPYNHRLLADAFENKLIPLYRLLFLGTGNTLTWEFLSLSWLLSSATQGGHYHTSLEEIAVLSISNLSAMESCSPFFPKNLPWEKCNHFSLRVLSFRHA